MADITLNSATLEAAIKLRREIEDGVANAKNGAKLSEREFAKLVATEGAVVGAAADEKSVKAAMGKLLAKLAGSNSGELGSADKRRKNEWGNFALAGAKGYFTLCDDAIADWLKNGGGSGEHMKRLRTMLGSHRGAKNAKPVPATVDHTALAAYFAETPIEKTAKILKRLVDAKRDVSGLTKAEANALQAVHMMIADRLDTDDETETEAPPAPPPAPPPVAQPTAPVNFSLDMLQNLQAGIAALIAKG